MGGRFQVIGHVGLGDLAQLVDTQSAVSSQRSARLALAVSIAAAM